MTTTTTFTPSAAQTTWSEPAGVNPRGTLVILPGQGENAAVYQRFARRLSNDAYRVVISSGPDQAKDLLADGHLVAPVVLVGSDTGAADALRVAGAAGNAVQALVLAGITVDGRAREFGPEDEIAARTACPAHRQVLGEVLTGSTLDAPAEVDELPTALVPALAFHGVADAISPVEDAVARYQAVGVTETHLVEDGLHDILNDVTHRSVAATTVLFLERLRLGSNLPAIVRPAPAHP